MKCKLLVAEDELIERKVLCKTLQKYLGDLIVLYEARNGREALELFAREAPQVVILDIEMPGYTGLEVARKIRETDKNCGRANRPERASDWEISSGGCPCSTRIPEKCRCSAGRGMAPSSGLRSLREKRRNGHEVQAAGGGG